MIHHRLCRSRIRDVMARRSLDDPSAGQIALQRPLMYLNQMPRRLPMVQILRVQYKSRAVTLAVTRRWWRLRKVGRRNLEPGRHTGKKKS